MTPYQLVNFYRRFGELPATIQIQILRSHGGIDEVYVFSGI
jgi:hypothetical protein